jgi:hypothetical protein
MSGDERFDRELRSVLHDLAADPAPDWLVERVASIPSHASAFTPRRSFMRIATALAAAAVLVVVAGVVLITRPGGGPPITGAPAASASPSTQATPSPAASPSVAPSAAPASSGSPAASGAPAGGPVPAGFQAVSVTFASPDLGWVLGTAPCAAQSCTSIVRTSDGGHTWIGIPAPRTPTIGGGLAAEAQVGTGVSALRFADPQNGWAFGPDLWATHDGGATWQRLSIPGASSAPVVALEASAGSVSAVLFDQSVVRVASSPVGTDNWRLSTTTVSIGAGPVPSAQLVLSGSSGWLVEVDRTVVGGARLVNGAWVAWTAPCASVVGPAVLAASSPTELVVACDVGLWSTPQGEHLYVSHDGGTTFMQTGALVPLDGAAEIASPGAGSVFVAGTASQGSAIVGSFDGGRTWQTVLITGQPGTPAALFTYLGFTSSTQGVAITASGTGTGNGQNVGTLLMTRDGGRTWSKVAFAGQ